MDKNCVIDFEVLERARREKAGLPYDPAAIATQRSYVAWKRHNHELMRLRDAAAKPDTSDT